MDFVLRDAYMSGYSTRAFDLERLLHYSVFTARGSRFTNGASRPWCGSSRSGPSCFGRSIFIARSGRSTWAARVFLDSKQHLFPGNPLEHLDEYQRLTEWSLLMEVRAGPKSDEPELRELGSALEGSASRLRWKMACEQTVFFVPGEAEQSSVFSNAAAFEAPWCVKHCRN